jgi:hypothetical protein
MMIGATLVVALLSADAMRKAGDHKGRPSVTMLQSL